MKNQKTMGNKGFSLVELIVVIAIMVVLVAVLAPVFTKYVEQSRRATDIQNASSIAESVLADAADGTISGDVSDETVVSGKPSAIKSDVKSRGNAIEKDKPFHYSYDATENKAKVWIEGAKTGVDLTIEKGDGTSTFGAQDYRDAAAAGLKN